MKKEKKWREGGREGKRKKEAILLGNGFLKFRKHSAHHCFVLFCFFPHPPPPPSPTSTLPQHITVNTFSATGWSHHITGSQRDESSHWWDLAVHRGFPRDSITHAHLKTELNTLGRNENLKGRIISQNNLGSFRGWATSQLGANPSRYCGGILDTPFSVTPPQKWLPGSRWMPLLHPRQPVWWSSFENLAFVCLFIYQTSKPQSFQCFLCHQLSLHSAF